MKFSISGQAFTPVPTIFLKKFMCDAPQDYVKVYLFGLCLAQAGEQMDELEMEDRLHMTAAQIEAALEYWTKKGFVKKRHSGRSDAYEFLQEQQEKTDDAPGKRPPVYEHQRYNNILNTLLNRTLSPSDLQKIYDYTEVFGLPQDVVITMIEYCVASRGANVSIAYLDKVAQSWAEENINSQEIAQQKIEEYKAMSGGAKKVMKQMGMVGKAPGKTELDLYNKWTEKWGFTLETILYSMRDKEFASASQPFKYLDGILRSLYENGITTSRKISEFNAARDRKREEIKEILATLDYSNKNSTPRHEKFYDEWKAAGYPHSIVLMACEQTAKSGYRRFEAVDALLREWKDKKLETPEDIKHDIQQQDELEDKVKQVFDCAGIKKPVGEADRKLYMTYVNEYNMNHDVLMMAADISSVSAAEPLPYLRKVLAAWAKKGVTTLEMAKQQQDMHFGDGKKDGRKEYGQREYTDEEKERRKLDIVKDMEKFYED